MRILILFVCLLTGCTTQLGNLQHRVHSKHYKKQYNRSIDSIKKHYFTQEAQGFIKDIPCVYGVTYSGSYVVGANFWGTLLGIISGSGYERKCVISPVGLRNWGPEVIIHEYIHHLDDVGRDGSKEFINLDEFQKAYARMSTDKRWRPLFVYSNTKGDRVVTNIFGLGHLSEQISYLGAHMALYGGPDYMWKVYRKVLKAPWERNN